jgi:hypothetical protein
MSSGQRQGRKRKEKAAFGYNPQDDNPSNSKYAKRYAAGGRMTMEKFINKQKSAHYDPTKAKEQQFFRNHKVQKKYAKYKKQLARDHPTGQKPTYTSRIEQLMAETEQMEGAEKKRKANLREQQRVHREEEAAAARKQASVEENEDDSSDSDSDTVTGGKAESQEPHKKKWTDEEYAEQIEKWRVEEEDQKLKVQQAANKRKKRHAKLSATHKHHRKGTHKGKGQTVMKFQAEDLLAKLHKNAKFRPQYNGGRR